MEYLKIKCHRCGNSFNVYHRNISSKEKMYCPHCLVAMDQRQWERLVDVYAQLAEINTNFRKHHEDRGEPLFQASICTEKKYVIPEKICLN